MSRLKAAFAAAQGAAFPGLIPYVTAGYPRLDDTVAVLRAVQDAGALAAEIGIPFSDPLADGPTIQRCGWQALRNGMTMRRALQQVEHARGDGVTIPLVLMGYVNPILAYGMTALATDAAAAGADGFIVPDLPAGEATELLAAAAPQGLDVIPLVAPTTPRSRIEAACRDAGGFIYCVSVTGVTGRRDEIAAEGLELLQRVRDCSALPRALGFGLSTAQHLQALAGHAEAAVVGSAFLEAIGADGDPAQLAADFVHGMVGG